MTKTCKVVASVCLVLPSTMVLASDWVEFTNETGARLVADAGLGSNDPEEKDYAWADVDQDGDVDLISVRKVIGSNSGSKRNVLFMNEDGALVDRTNEYATAATDGGNGFLDLTPDRDVALVDVNDDGWLDIVTVPAGAYSNLPKTISHPRIYINLGEDRDGWLGFRYEEERIPQLVADPNFCGVGTGDVNDDGSPDLYFGDYFNGLGDRLLINDGAGFFTDETDARFPGNSGFLSSTFTTSTEIVDLNGDGYNDIIKASALGPYELRAVYNDPDNPGFYPSTSMETVLSGSSYHVEIADLNNDGLMDIVEVDDGSDRYLLNEGNGANGRADFHNGGSGSTFENSSGFGSNVAFGDLNRDGFQDVLIADVDVDLTACSGARTLVYRNLANPLIVSFDEDPANLPTGQNQGSPLAGTHDIAIFDINGDNWDDLVIGTCAGTTVWINQPTLAGVDFEYPDGLPAIIAPDESFALSVDLVVFGAKVVPGSAQLHVATNGGGFNMFPMQQIDGSLYEATLPASSCLDVLNYYVSVELTGAGVFTDPADAPDSTFTTLVAEGTKIAFADDMEGDVSGWTVESTDLTSGEWQRANPNGTIYLGDQAAPEDDATEGAGIRAFVTENGQPGGDAIASDLDGGPTTLDSPLIDLAGSDAMISYAAWVFSADLANDQLDVQVSNNAGQSWTTVDSISSTASTWERRSFRVGEFIEPTAEVQVRFSISDNPNDSVTEAGIDDFQVDQLMCGDTCVADLDADGVVGSNDLIALLGAWGENPGHPADFDGDGTVGTTDLLVLLGAWGECP